MPYPTGRFVSEPKTVTHFVDAKDDEVVNNGIATTGMTLVPQN